MPASRLPFHYKRASFVGAGAGPGDGDGDGKGAMVGIKGDAIADIVAAEHGLKLSESKKIVATVFDTIVEVRDFVIFFAQVRFPISGVFIPGHF
jgi:hypothetical protein